MIFIFKAKKYFVRKENLLFSISVEMKEVNVVCYIVLINSPNYRKNIILSHFSDYIVHPKTNY